MRTVVILLLSMAFCAPVLAQDPEFEWIRKVRNVSGKITMVSEDTWVIVPSDNQSGRYFSSQLPKEYKKEGLMVTFCGKVGKIPPNVRMLATPLKLSVIKVSKSEAQKFGLEKRKYKFK